MSISYRETSGSDLRIFPSGKVWNFVKSQNKTILRQKRPVSSCLGPECGAFIKMANRPEIPDSYPFKSHLLALQPLSLLFRHEKNHFHKNDPKNINHDKTFFCYLVYIKMWNCVWLELKLHAALNPYYQHDIRRHELTHENFMLRQIQRNDVINNKKHRKNCKSWPAQVSHEYVPCHKIDKSKSKESVG